MGVGGKLNLAAARDDAFDGGFQGRAGGGGVGLSAHLIGLDGFVVAEGVLEGGDFDGLHAGQGILGQLGKDIQGGLFEDGAAVIPFVADGVIFEGGGIVGGVFLPGALLHFFDQFNEYFHQAGFVAGDALFAGGHLDGVARQGVGRRNVGGQGGEFGGINAARREHRGVFGLLRGGNDLPGVVE